MVMNLKQLLNQHTEKVNNMMNQRENIGRLTSHGDATFEKLFQFAKEQNPKDEDDWFNYNDKWDINIWYQVHTTYSEDQGEKEIGMWHASAYMVIDQKTRTDLGSIPLY